MKISPLCTNKYLYSQSFGMRADVVRDDEGRFKHRTTTFFFRDDINWNRAFNNLMKHFENKDHVDVYCIGCSDGSEAYSAAMMIKLLSDNPNKFLPIKASDYDEKVIDMAKTGKYLITEDEFERFGKYAKGKWRNYLDKTSSTNSEIAELVSMTVSDPHGIYLVNENIKNDVEFKVEDCMKTLDKMAKKGPKIIMCRNFWPYMSEFKRGDFAKKLGRKLESGSVVIIGGYDFGADAGDWLKLCGFKDMSENDCGAINSEMIWVKK